MSENESGQAPLVGVIMGSTSDWPTMQAATEILAQFDIPFEARVVSAHRTPDLMADYARTAASRGLRAIMEEVLLDVMYDIPSREDIGRCVITDDVVMERVNPTLVSRSDEEREQRRAAS